MAFCSISPKLKFLFIFLHLFSLTPLSLSSSNLPLDIKDTVKEDIHDLFPKYNIPIGLLPGNVKSYHLSDDNSFTVELTHHCYVYFDEQLAYYGTKIKGKLEYGRVYDVSGIQAKKFLVWVNVNYMKVDDKSDMIEFHVGPFFEKLPAKAFQSIPDCLKKPFQETESASV